MGYGWIHAVSRQRSHTFSKEEIDFYMHVNYVPEAPRMFFVGVALGEFPDYTIGDEEETQQKDAGSSSTA